MRFPVPSTRPAAVLLALAFVVALVPAPAAAALSPGSVLHVRLAGPSQEPGAGNPVDAAAALEVTAEVTAADGGNRSGLADVSLDAERGYRSRSYTFTNVEWSGSVEQTGGTLDAVTLEIPRTRVGGNFLSVTVHGHGEASGEGALAASGAWQMGDVRCTGSNDDGDAFDDHGDKDHCVGVTQETGDGLGTATASG